MGNHTEVFTVRKGTKNDVKAVHALIVELAIYERAEQEVSNTVDQLLTETVLGRIRSMNCWWQKRKERWSEWLCGTRSIARGRASAGT